MEIVVIYFIIISVILCFMLFNSLLFFNLPIFWTCIYLQPLQINFPVSQCPLRFQFKTTVAWTKTESLQNFPLGHNEINTTTFSAKWLKENKGFAFSCFDQWTVATVSSFWTRTHGEVQTCGSFNAVCVFYVQNLRRL